MECRTLGRTGLEVGVIGLGTEHLVRQRGTMDEVLRMAVEAGVNYVDLLYVDVTDADAEFWESFRPALRRHRDKLTLAAHWGSGPRCEMDYCRRCFKEVLGQVGNGYAQIGLLTMVDDEEKWAGWAQESVEHLLRYKEQGRVGHIGLSSHDSSTALRAVTSGLIDVLMFPINLLGHDSEVDRALYEACVEQDVGLVAMKPYHGGTLLFAGGRPSGIAPAQCLDYVLSLPVSTVVPGPKNVEELRATLHYLDATGEERDYRPVIAGLHDHLEGQCVYCHHCLPCPQGISIGWLIWLVDHAHDGVTDELVAWYSGHEAKASECTECGVCLERCPFGVDIVAKMRRAVELFEARAA